MKVFFLGCLIRVALVYYGIEIDSSSKVKYTDVDYSVYTDAAGYMLKGQSPFDRHTYRYTPLLAIMMIPNQILFVHFGKFLFIAFDVVSSILTKKILKMTTTLSDN